MRNQNQGNNAYADNLSVLIPSPLKTLPRWPLCAPLLSQTKDACRGRTPARPPLNAIMERVSTPDGVTYEADTVGGVSGLWCKPAHARPGEVVLHIHGGWFNWGSAHAFRHMVGHIAARGGVQAFVPDYRLAPEYPFRPHQDIRASYLVCSNGDFLGCGDR